MKMKVYHGSYTTIDKIDLSKAEENKDFGKGFYVTKFRHQAETWAKRKGKRNGTTGVVSEFEYSDNGFIRSICKIKQFEGYNEEWLDFVVMNRDANNPNQAHDYDIVEGPVADDQVQNRILDYLRGEVSKADFLEDLTWHEQTHQICFCTLNSLQAIGPPVTMWSDVEWHIKKIGEPLIERLMLDTGMDEGRATDAFYTSETFARLADEATGYHHKPWQDIYEMLRAELKI
jgi:hypothetical protein